MRRPRVAIPLFRRKQACRSRQPPYVTIFSFICNSDPLNLRWVSGASAGAASGNLFSDFPELESFTAHKASLHHQIWLIDCSMISEGAAHAFLMKALGPATAPASRSERPFRNFVALRDLSLLSDEPY